MNTQKPDVVPRGITPQAFQQAIEKFRSLLGDENILIKPEQLVSYKKS